MSYLRFFIVGGLLLWASLSWAGGSSVGGGTLSNDDVGFLSTMPMSYNRFDISADQDVSMRAPPVLKNGKLQPRFVNAYLLHNEQPQWVGKTDRAEFRNHYLALGWQPIFHQDVCVEMFEKVNSDTITRLLSWGDGRGVIFCLDLSARVGCEINVRWFIDSSRSVFMEVTVAEFTDYRDYMRALFESKKKLNRRFSFRRFCAIVGFKSPNYLQMILDGRRNLSPDTAYTIATRLKISPGERDYFVALVKRAAAANESERNEAERARLAALKKMVARDIPAAKKEIFDRWFYLLTRELFSLKNARTDAEWISSKLGGLVSPTDAANAVEILVRLGMLSPTDTGYKPSDSVLITDERQLQAAMMRAFHADTLRTWAANLDKLCPSEQELGILNLPISSEKIPELRRRIRQFHDEILGWIQDDTEANRVVQIGTYLIPFP